MRNRRFELGLLRSATTWFVYFTRPQIRASVRPPPAFSERREIWVRRCQRRLAQVLSKRRSPIRFLPRRSGYLNSIARYRGAAQRGAARRDATVFRQNALKFAKWSERAAGNPRNLPTLRFELQRFSVKIYFMKNTKIRILLLTTNRYNDVLHERYHCKTYTLLYTL